MIGLGEMHVGDIAQSRQHYSFGDSSGAQPDCDRLLCHLYDLEHRRLNWNR